MKKLLLILLLLSNPSLYSLTIHNNTNYLLYFSCFESIKPETCISLKHVKHTLIKKAKRTLPNNTKIDIKSLFNIDSKIYVLNPHEKTTIPNELYEIILKEQGGLLCEFGLWTTFANPLILNVYLTDPNPQLSIVLTKNGVKALPIK